jgi:hypothetical protein
MRKVMCAVLGVSAELVGIGIAYAGTAPAALRGKSIHVEYTVTSTHSDDSRRHVSSISRTIYVSTTGRLFEQARWATRRRTVVGQNDPGSSHNKGHEARGMSFQGNALVASIGYASGAGQMTITFDPSFSNCSGQVKFGKNSGQTMARRGLDGRVHQITLITTSSLSCSVAAGNPF